MTLLDASPDSPAFVYLLHYARPLSQDPATHPRRHYIGWAVDPDTRFHLHATGQARATFTQVAAYRGIPFTPVVLGQYQTRAEARAAERQLKNHKRAADFCPHCGGRKAPRVSH